MKLDLTQLKSITSGAVRIEKDDMGVVFYRFTKQQQVFYDNSYLNSARAYSTSGVQMNFKTDSTKLSLDINIPAAGGRRYFAFDIFVNGDKVDTIKNFDEKSFPSNYAEVEFPLGEFSKEINLGDGTKEVKIVFPWSVVALLKRMELDDNSTIIPIKRKKKMLCFGDSITQGYDALYPSDKYITRVADYLDAEEINKAIGGEVFVPELAGLKDDVEPDYIIIAYGTNHWTFTDKDTLIKDCNKFYDNIVKNYPKAKIYAIAPLWRKDCKEPNQFDNFMEIHEIIKSTALKYENVKYISAFDFIPKEESYFADTRLHPNDKGFAEYYKNLIKEL